MKSVMTTFTPPCEDAEQEAFTYNVDLEDIDAFIAKIFEEDLPTESQTQSAYPHQVERLGNKLLTLEDPLLSATSVPNKMLVPICEDFNGGTGCVESYAELELIYENNPNNNTTADYHQMNSDPHTKEWSGLGTDLSSASTSQGASIEDLGEVEWKVQNIEHRKGSWLTCYSEENHLYHVQSGRNGRFKININYKNIPTNQDGLYFVRSVLIRSNPAYSHFPVDRVCKIHSSPGSPNQPIQPLPGAVEGGYALTESTATSMRPSLLQWVPRPDYEGNIRADLEMIFMCNDSCANSSLPQCKGEAARNLYLVSTLEMKYGDAVTVLARSKVPVWIKASVCKRDLDKKIRRKPKGAAAQKTKMEKRMREETEEKIMNKVIKTEVPSATGFDYHLDQLVLGIKHGQITEQEIWNKIRQRITQ